MTQSQYLFDKSSRSPTNPITVPILGRVCLVAYTELEVPRVWRQCQLEGECVVNHIRAAGPGDLRVRAECVSLRLPTVPCRPDEDFFVEAQIFHLDGANDCRL